jgi:hypothetical protein
VQPGAAADAGSRRRPHQQAAWHDATALGLD